MGITNEREELAYEIAYTETLYARQTNQIRRKQEELNALKTVRQSTAMNLAGLYTKFDQQAGANK